MQAEGIVNTNQGRLQHFFLLCMASEWRSTLGVRQVAAALPAGSPTLALVGADLGGSVGRCVGLSWAYSYAGRNQVCPASPLAWLRPGPARRSGPRVGWRRPRGPGNGSAGGKGGHGCRDIGFRTFEKFVTAPAPEGLGFPDYPRLRALAVSEPGVMNAREYDLLTAAPAMSREKAGAEKGGAPSARPRPSRTTAQRRAIVRAPDLGRKLYVAGLSLTGTRFRRCEGRQAVCARPAPISL
jgi:hypothetical protein